MASQNKIRAFINYCLDHKSLDRLRNDFYRVQSVNIKECREFGLIDHEWRYCIRKALDKKRKELDAKQKEEYSYPDD